MPALEIQDLSFSYGRARVLRDVSLVVDKGEVVTVIGPNGAGKSTMLSVVAGVLRAQRGSVHVHGRDITGMKQPSRVRSGLVLVPEGRQVFSSLSVEDNLRLGAYARRRKASFEKELKEVFEVFPRLADRRDQLAGTLSGGEQSMLAIGRALMGKPNLLLLDEPTLGLSPQMTHLIMTTLGQLRSEGHTIVLVEQNALAALKLADRGYLLHTGEVVRSGTSEELMADDFVRHVYLGSTPESGATVAGETLDRESQRQA